MNTPLWFEPDTEPNPVVRVDRLNFAYGEGDAKNQVLFDISCAVQPGQLVAMTGPSGSGKTTLLRAIAGLEAFEQGAIVVDGVVLGGGPPVALSIRDLRRKVGRWERSQCQKSSRLSSDSTVSPFTYVI